MNGREGAAGRNGVDGIGLNNPRFVTLIREIKYPS